MKFPISLLFFAFWIAATGNDAIISLDAAMKQSADNNEFVLVGNTKTEQEGGIACYRFDGKNSGIIVKNSKKICIANGATFIATVKFDDHITTVDQAARHDAVFYKDKEFVLGRRCDYFYANFYNGEKWTNGLQSDQNYRYGPDPNLKYQPGKWYNIAVSFSYHDSPSQGEKWTLIKMYLNGLKVAQTKINNAIPNKSQEPLQIGRANGFGNVWQMNGMLKNVHVFERVLSDYEIEQIATEEKFITPFFSQAPALTQNDQEKLNRLREMIAKQENKRYQAIAYALLDCVEKMCLLNGDKLNTEDPFHALEKSLQRSRNPEELLENWHQFQQVTTLISPHSALSFRLDSKTERFYLLSWFDCDNLRSVIHHQSKLWEVRTPQGSFTPSSKGVKARLLEMPKSIGDDVSFLVEWTHEIFKIQSKFTLSGKRLSYDINAKSLEGTLNELVFPAITLNPIDPDSDRLLVPLMSGVEYPRAMQNSTIYQASYPTGSASMQMGAFYDKKSGIYFALEDLAAGSKEIIFSASPKGLDTKWIWPNHQKEFAPDAQAVLTLFNGDWYDASQIYKNYLRQKKPVWWTEKIPRKDSPAWFSQNTLWFRYYGSRVDELEKIRDFLQLPFALHWYCWNGEFDRDYPHFYSNSRTDKLIRQLKEKNFPIVAYTNGRLWETRDRQDQDWQFTSRALPSVAKDEQNRPVIENYSGASFGVMCPATQLWQDELCEITLSVSQFGFDGIYYDQIAAARPVICNALQHGHLRGHYNTWLDAGYWKAFSKIRRDIQKNNRKMVLTSEDVSEPYMKMFDGMVPWRWMFNHQVPLVPAVYSGQTQFTGLSFGREEPAARFPMLATQFVNGEQLGWFRVEKFVILFSSEFRKYVRLLIHMRLAMLDFFNGGEMLRPLQFTQKIDKMTLHWGVYGTQQVDSEAIMSSVWHLNNHYAIILVNTTGECQKNSFLLPRELWKDKDCFFFGSDQVEINNGKVSFEVSPYNVILVLLAPHESAYAQGKKEQWEEIFRKIAILNRQKDPFASDIKTQSERWAKYYQVIEKLKNKE